MTTANNYTKHLASLALRGGTHWLARRARMAVALATLLAIVAPASGPPAVTRAQALASAPLTGAANPLCFNPPVITSSVGTTPVSLAALDWDGDGKPDLAVANQGSNDVGILHGNGDGTFQSPSAFYVVGNHPSSIAAGDFNRDGRPDLAVANQFANTVSIVFSNQPTLTFGVGTHPSFIAVGDWNGDGKSDLAVTNQYPDNNVSILLGNGNGTFQETPLVHVGVNPVSIAVGDFDGNGKPDLAVANQGSNNVSILVSSGGGFLLAPTPTVGVGFNPSSVVARDLNGDGKLDLAVVDQGFNSNTANVAILLGNGDATFQAAQFFGVGTSPTSVAVADWNGDGRPDLAVANGGSNNVSILLGNGDGTFQAPQFFAAGTGPASIAVGDWNGGGKPDLAVVNGGSNDVFTWFACPTPAVSLNPTSLDFGSQLVGTNSNPQYVTLSNIGDGPLTISNITISGDFAQNNGCGGSLAAGASCVFYVTFTPTAPGSRAGTLTISDDATGSPHTVALRGMGTGPAVSLSRTSLGFGNQLVGTTSATQIVTLVNSGNDLLTISSIAASGDFSGDLESDPFCDPLLGIAPGDSCLIDVTFTPTTMGSRTGTLTITDNALGSPHTVALSGTGTAPADTTPPTITISAPTNSMYMLNQAVAASYSCADESGGSGLASCVGSVPNGSNIDTASVGAKTFTVNAADNAGNAASASVAYTVIYTFRGFFQPVDSLPVLNAVKAGSAIPVKFSLAGNQGLTILAAAYPKSQPIACDSAAPVDDIEQTVTAGSSSLTYDAASDQYSYVWKTDKAWAGSCRQLIVRLADGTDHRANFTFK